MNQQLSITEKIKTMLQLPVDGALKEYSKYCLAAEVLEKPVVTQEELLDALKNHHDHDLLEYFKTTFFYAWDEAKGENLNFNTPPLSQERREEIYQKLDLNEDYKEYLMKI